MYTSHSLLKKLEFYIKQAENIIHSASPASFTEAKTVIDMEDQEFNQMELKNMKKFVGQLAQRPNNSPVSWWDILEGLNLSPHAEEGFYRRFLRTKDATFTFYLLPPDTGSAWHRLDGVQETFRWVAGDPLYIPRVSREGSWKGIEELTECGPDVVITAAGQADEKNGHFGDWFGAYHFGNYSFVTCECRPPFQWQKWQLASPDDVQKFYGVDPDFLEIVDKLVPKTV